MNDKEVPTDEWESGVVISPDTLEGERCGIGVTKPCRQTNWKVADQRIRGNEGMKIILNTYYPRCRIRLTIPGSER
jgi:hypothetical protein